MSAVNSSEHFGENWQQIGVSCCCTVAQAARSGHCEEINQLIRAGTSFPSSSLFGSSVHVVSGCEFHCQILDHLALCGLTLSLVCG